MRSVLVIIFVLIPTLCLSLTQADIECVMGEWEKFLIQKKKYIWGDWDCSKAFAEAHSNCGIALQRCTSRDYAEGLCGFESEEIGIDQTRRGDAVFWSWGRHKNAVDREYGHIGQTEDSDTVYHNSSGRKRVVKDDFLGILIGDLEDFARRWIMDDEPDPIAPPEIKVTKKEPKKKSFWKRWF